MHSVRLGPTTWALVRVRSTYYSIADADDGHSKTNMIQYEVSARTPRATPLQYKTPTKKLGSKKVRLGSAGQLEVRETCMLKLVLNAPPPN